MKQGDTRIPIMFVDQGVAFGGSLVVIAHIVRHLDKKKYRPIVVGEMDEDIIRHHMQNNADIYVIKHIFNYVHWDKLVTPLKRIKFKWLRKMIAYFFSFIKMLLNIPYMLGVAWVIYKENVKLVHINNSIDALPVAWALGRKTVWHFHGIWGKEPPGLIEGLCFRAVTKFVAISEVVKRAAVREAGFPIEQVKTLLNPVEIMSVSDDVVRSVKDKHGIVEGELTFGIVGRIVGWKGQKEFIQAAKLVFEQLDNVKAFIVGDGSDVSDNYEQEVHDLIDEYGLHDKVIFTGYTHHVENYYAAMDVAVHASIEPEPFGLVITEAMSFGLPVVAANAGAPLEIINDGEDGFLADPFNATELSEKIVMLLRDEALRNKIGEKAREKTIEVFDAKHYAIELEKVYQEVLSE